MKKIIVILCLALWHTVSFAEKESMQSLTVLPSADTSELGLGEPLQYALGQVLNSTGALKIQLSGYAVSGFTPSDIAKAFDVLQSDLLSFTYMEKTRISVFLFARNRPKEFIVAYRAFDDAPGGQLTSEYVEQKFKESVGEMLALYSGGAFQNLPGTKSDNASLDREEMNQRAQEARILYRELASLEKKNWYLGANIGMARYTQANETSVSRSNSAVNLGGIAGTQLDKQFAVEAGLSAFSYLLLHGDVRYHIELLEKYVDLSVTGGFGRIMGAISENARETNNISLAGSMIFGPGIGFDVPLLGTTLRGEVRYYFGSTSLLVGTYGILIAI